MSLTVCGHRIDSILVIGYGVTGRAVVRFAVRHGLTPAMSERGELPPQDRRSLDAWRVRYETGGHTTALLDGIDAVVPSPGVHADHPILRAAAERKIPVVSELDLAAASYAPKPIVAVTGTNGKSTVVSLIGAILEWRGLRAPVVGNIGDPFIALVDSDRPTDVAVVEVSSYQLEQSVCFRPRVGVLLNLTPDHLEHHGSLEAYVAAKARLFALQRATDVAILPRTEATRFAEGAGCRHFYDDEMPMPPWADRLSPHNRANLRAAIAACDALLGVPGSCEVPWNVVRLALSLPYRMEPIGFLGEIRVINDSKSTNADSSVAAIRTMETPTILLLGGHFKGGGYEALCDALWGSRVRRIVLFGEAAPLLSGFVERSGVPYDTARRLADAVSLAIGFARPGETLLLSPGCSSFDEFSDYLDRGRSFTALIAARPDFRPVAQHKDARLEETGHMSSLE